MKRDKNYSLKDRIGAKKGLELTATSLDVAFANKQRVAAVHAVFPVHTRVDNFSTLVFLNRCNFYV